MHLASVPLDGNQGSRLMTASDMIISIMCQHGMVLCFMFAIRPAFQAGRARVLLRGWGCEFCGKSEPMATTFKSAQCFPQLAICHCSEIILKLINLLWSGCMRLSLTPCVPSCQSYAPSCISGSKHEIQLDWCMLHQRSSRWCEHGVQHGDLAIDQHELTSYYVWCTHWSQMRG